MNCLICFFFFFYSRREVYAAEGRITASRKSSYDYKDVTTKYRNIKSGGQVIGIEEKEVEVFVYNKTTEAVRRYTRLGPFFRHPRVRNQGEVVGRKNLAGSNQEGERQEVRNERGSFQEEVEQEVRNGNFSNQEEVEQEVRNGSSGVRFREEVEQQVVGCSSGDCILEDIEEKEVSESSAVRQPLVRSILKVRNRREEERPEKSIEDLEAEYFEDLDSQGKHTNKYCKFTYTAKKI